MKITVPQITEALAELRQSPPVVRVVHVHAAPWEIILALFAIAAGLLAVADAIGSRVAGQRGGHRGR